MCVCERERERERGRAGERERASEREKERERGEGGGGEKHKTPHSDISEPKHLGRYRSKVTQVEQAGIATSLPSFLHGRITLSVSVCEGVAAELALLPTKVRALLAPRPVESSKLASSKLASQSRVVS